MNHVPSEAEQVTAKNYLDVLIAVAESRSVPWIPTALLLAIPSRETWWGHAPGYVDIYGTPGDLADDVGDRGHGHGFFQWDDRSWKSWLKTNKWKSVRWAAHKCVDLLLSNHLYLKRKLPGRPESIYVMGAIAGYNCGVGNVRKALAKKLDVDAYTHGGDYSEDVLSLEQWWLHHFMLNERRP